MIWSWWWRTQENRPERSSSTGWAQGQFHHCPLDVRKEQVGTSQKKIVFNSNPCTSSFVFHFGWKGLTLLKWHITLMWTFSYISQHVFHAEREWKCWYDSRHLQFNLKIIFLKCLTHLAKLSSFIINMYGFYLKTLTELSQCVLTLSWTKSKIVYIPLMQYPNVRQLSGWYSRNQTLLDKHEALWHNTRTLHTFMKHDQKYSRGKQVSERVSNSRNDNTGSDGERGHQLWLVLNMKGVVASSQSFKQSTHACLKGDCWGKNKQASFSLKHVSYAVPYFLTFTTLNIKLLREDICFYEAFHQTVTIALTCFMAQTKQCEAPTMGVLF